MRNICDEVIVLDSESNDLTRQISEKEGAKVFVQPFLGDGAQKKEASKFASNDWIFSMDADELLDDDLVNYVKRINFEKNSYDSFSFRRMMMIGWSQIA